MFKECAERRLTVVLLVLVVGGSRFCNQLCTVKQTSWRFDAALSYPSVLSGEGSVRTEGKTNTYFTKKKRICDCGKQQNVNCIVPGGASAGLLPDGGGGRSTGRGSFEGKGGRERKRWRQIEGLSLIQLPYRRVHSAGSAAVSKLKLTGSAGAACSNGPAGARPDRH